MTETSEPDPVLVDCAGGVARITLNRPARKNALTRATLVRLREALEQVGANESVRVVAIAGAGGAFCAGQDLGERNPRALPSWPLDLAGLQAELYHPVIRLIRSAPKPVVAVVEGAAAGAGAALALSADITLAARSARFVFSFVRVGLSVDAGLGWALARRLGAQRARALLMLGETLGAEEAAAAGLIWRAVADEDLAAAAHDILRGLKSAPRQALRSIKSAVAEAEGAAFDAYLRREAELQGLAGVDPDYAEGVTAFLDRRKPNFA